MPYNVLSNIPKFLDNDIIDEILLPMGYGKAIYIYQAMTLTKDSVLWNGLP
jgi:hypothetical protein